MKFLIFLSTLDERKENLENHFNNFENDLEVRFESLKIHADELLDQSLDDLDKFETILNEKISKYKIDSNIDENKNLKINFKNFPYKPFKLIKQFYIGCTDLIITDVYLSCI